MSLLMFKISAFLFNTSVDLHESPTTLSCCNIDRTYWTWSGLWRKSCLCLL